MWKEVKTKRAFYEHFNIFHKEEKLKCEKCDRGFPFKSHLKIHIEKCDGVKKPEKDKRYQCKKCVKKFNTNGLIYQHMIHVHRKKKIECNNCDKKFPIPSVLRTHLKTCKSNKKSESQEKNDISSEDLKSKSKSESSSKNSAITEKAANINAIDFGNIEINIDDDVLEIYAWFFHYSFVNLAK